MVMCLSLCDFQQLSVSVSVWEGQVCGSFPGLVDAVYAGVVVCLYDLCGVCATVFCKMEELILCESLGVWGYVYAGSVALHEYLGHRVQGGVFAYL